MHQDTETTIYWSINHSTYLHSECDGGYKSQLVHDVKIDKLNKK